MGDKLNETQGAGALNRRDFVKLGAMGVGAVMGGASQSAEAQASVVGQVQPFPVPNLGPAPEKPFAAPAMDRVRVGFVGVGGMGTSHVKNLLRIDGVDLKAVCDIVPEKCANIQRLAHEAGKEKPTVYTKGDHDFVRMCETEDLDLVYTATPWRWHVPVLVAAMNNGKHAATEVPATFTMEECWQMIEVSEKQKKHCVMMENCCYDRTEMLIFNMVRKGLLGELIHGECGYLHDLRGVKFGSGGEGLWRREHSIQRDGNLYTTHGIGPIAQAMDVNRGDRFDYLVSMSSKSRGLQLWQEEHLKKDDPRRNEEYKLGDVNITMIRTMKGCTITLIHDTNLPRPYSRVNMLQGTKGVARKWPAEQIYMEGKTEGHSFEDLSKYAKEYDHPLWKAKEKEAMGAGHGGMDFIEDWRLIHCLLNGLPTDVDVYDAAAWSALGPLSEESVANRGRSVDVPDFTRGNWKTRAPFPIFNV
jgi:predicted dehydrogenase